MAPKGDKHSACWLRGTMEKKLQQFKPPYQQKLEKTIRMVHGKYGSIWILGKGGGDIGTNTNKNSDFEAFLPWISLNSLRLL